MGAEVAFALASPGGSLRFRWCQAIRGGGSLTLQADSPLWRREEASAPANELVMSGLAAGRYVIGSEAGGGLTG